VQGVAQNSSALRLRQVGFLFLAVLGLGLLLQLITVDALWVQDRSKGKEEFDVVLSEIKTLPEVEEDFFSEVNHEFQLERDDKAQIFLQKMSNPSLLQAKSIIERGIRAFEPLRERIISKNDLVRLFGDKILRRQDSKATLDMFLESNEMLPRQFRRNRIIFFITPTYRRRSQIVDLLRIKQMLQTAALLHDGIPYWVLVEDSRFCTLRIRQLLMDSKLPFAHLSAQSKTQNPHRGVAQRNRALDVIESIDVEGVVYFGDDDNGFDAQLFTELASIKQVGIAGVAFTGEQQYERCHVDPKTGSVDKIISTWRVDERLYPMDMGGFGMSTETMRSRNARFQFEWKKGTLETRFLEVLVPGGPSFLQPLAGNCTKILAFHIKTMVPPKTETQRADPISVLSNLI